MGRKETGSPGETHFECAGAAYAGDTGVVQTKHGERTAAGGGKTHESA
ncbi:MAG: hypothetical protein WA766_18075 [Candidatus Acidiferrales bacterium]